MKVINLVSAFILIIKDIFVIILLPFRIWIEKAKYYVNEAFESAVRNMLTYICSVMLIRFKFFQPLP